MRIQACALLYQFVFYPYDGDTNTLTSLLKELNETVVQQEETMRQLREHNTIRDEEIQQLRLNNTALEQRLSELEGIYFKHYCPH